MKAKIIPISSILFSALLFTSCEDSTYREYTGNSPVYMSYEKLRSSVSLDESVSLRNPGKIYFKDNFIFIVEEQEGIHVYDNTDPSSPVKKTFIVIPGVVDISISGFYLYADSYVDLVVMNISDIDDIIPVGRVKNVLPYTVPAVDNDLPMAAIDEDKGVVIDWEVKKIREKVNTNYYPYPIFWEKGGIYYDMVNAGGASTGASGSGVGVGGSMARFGIKDDVLYILDQSSIGIFDISLKASPVKAGTVWGGWNMETMFLTEDKMFLGTTTGMIIYNIEVPLYPQYLTSFSHARSCDPVIVDDTLAYVTLRTGTNCGGAANTLNVINIKNILAPSLVASYSMTNPHGLGKDGDLLFVCDGTSGLKIFDASDPKTITSHHIKTYGDLDAFDVIPMSNVLFMIGDDGLYQFDYSDVMNISLLSSINVVEER
jgi:hypothetical protein